MLDTLMYVYGTNMDTLGVYNLMEFTNALKKRPKYGEVWG